MNRIRELRKDKNIIQEYLAQQLGVANLIISKWERGIHQIKSDNLLRNIDKLTSQNLSDIKREARNLYESLVRLQCEAERIETWKKS
jgi:transcriptional regulator with XRE-family HTH domain